MGHKHCSTRSRLIGSQEEGRLTIVVRRKKSSSALKVVCMLSYARPYVQDHVQYYDTVSRCESVVHHGPSPPVVIRASLECCFVAMTSQIDGSKGHC